MRKRAGSARPRLADIRKELAGSIVDHDASLAGARCADSSWDSFQGLNGNQILSCSISQMLRES